MASYYTPWSLALVGTREVLRCQMTDGFMSTNGKPVPCAGPVSFTWVHGGHGDGEVRACQAWIDRNFDPTYGDAHALSRDADGIWQLRPDAAMHPSIPFELW